MRFAVYLLGCEVFAVSTDPDDGAGDHDADHGGQFVGFAERAKPYELDVPEHVNH